ncbi:MAG: serine hydrolase domain-containing protein [Mycobacteriales bacterium]
MRLAELARLHQVPGAALAVLVDDEIHECAIGLANKRTAVEATPDTLFQIGSVTKPWTASLLLTLVDDGRLDLDDHVAHILPSFETPDPATTNGLTVRHLLNHTSGLPGDHFPDTGRGDDCLQRYADLLRGGELAHPLGAMYSYSNAAFAVAGLIVQTVLGKTWESALRERIIEPLGLQHTVTLPEEALLHRAAVGHVGSGDEQHVTPVWGLPRFCGPSGLIVAQARDVVSFARMHLSGGFAQDGARVLSEASVDAMRTPTVRVPGTSHSVGLGWGLQEWDGDQVLAHDGGTIGQAAALRILVEQRVAIALLTNGGDWLAFREAALGEIALEVAGVVVPSMPVPPEHGAAHAPSDYTGHFRRAGVDVHIADRDGQLWASHAFTEEFAALAGPRRPPVPLRSGEPDVFYAKPGAGPWTRLTFMRDAAGCVSYLHSGNRVARRVSEADSSS